jgi:endonuclease YncB( thermonuclease family)
VTVKRLLAFLAILVAVVLVGAAAAPNPPAKPAPGIALRGHVFDVHDGDTLYVDVNFTLHVRLLDCWAPEITGTEKPEGLKSKTEAIRLAGDKDVTVWIPAAGDNLGNMTTLGRVLGHVWVDGQPKSVNVQMVEGGFATSKKD